MEKVKSVQWCHNNVGEQLFFSMDLQPITAGIGYDITSWKHHGISPAPFFRIYLLLTGEFQVRFPSETHTLTAGNMYFLPRHESFTYKSITPCTHYYFHFNSHALSDILFCRQLLSKPAGKNEIACFKHLLQARKNTRSMQTLLDEKVIMHKLLMPFFLPVPSNKLEMLNLESHFLPVVDYLNQNLDKDIEIAELGNIAGMSRAKFSARFRQLFGVPPKQYISICRIQRAKELLCQTKYSGAEIARMTGYRNVFFFYKMFKKYVNCTPSRFREVNVLD